MNGDIYSKRDDILASDTQWLFDRIVDCKVNYNILWHIESHLYVIIISIKDDTDLLALFRTIKGPYSIIYFNEATNALYFMRDSLGRQSLLLGKSDGDVWLTSVAWNLFDEFTFIEVPPLGIFKIKLNTSPIDRVDLYPWQMIDTHEMYAQQVNEVQELFDVPVCVLETINPKWLGPGMKSFEVFLFDICI